MLPLSLRAWVQAQGDAGVVGVDGVGVAGHAHRKWTLSRQPRLVGVWVGRGTCRPRAFTGTRLTCAPHWGKQFWFTDRGLAQHALLPTQQHPTTLHAGVHASSCGAAGDRSASLPPVRELARLACRQAPAHAHSFAERGGTPTPLRQPPFLHGGAWRSVGQCVGRCAVGQRGCRLGSALPHLRVAGVPPPLAQHVERTRLPVLHTPY